MNLTLIGMTGAGKSYWGKILAQHFNLDFIDSDLLLIEKFHLSLQEILDNLGDDNFIKTEDDVIRNALFEKENWVLAPGGSIIYNNQLIDFLKSKSLIIYIQSDPQEIIRRINLNPRGVVGLKRLGSFEAVYKERLGLYEVAADIYFDPGKQSLDNLINLISSKMK